MRSRTVVLVVIAALLAASPVVAAQGKPVTPTDAGGGQGQEKGADKANERGVQVGAFDVDAVQGHAEGSFVAFDYNASGLFDFSVNGVRLFDLTVMGGPIQELTRLEAKGAQMTMQGRGFKLTVHDNPGAVARISADRGVTMAFGEGARLAGTSGGTQAAFDVGTISGKVRGQNVSVEGNLVRAEGDILFLLDSVRGAFDAHRADITRAIERGHVGAEASFTRVNGALSEDIISYGNVHITRVESVDASLTLLIDGEGLAGRVLVFNVDGRIVGASGEGDLRIQFDNASIPKASNLVDILDPDNDGLGPEYYVIFDVDAQVFQLLVSVPHYSVHTLSMSGVTFLPPPAVTIGLLVGVVLLVPSAYVLFRRPTE